MKLHKKVHFNLHGHKGHKRVSLLQVNLGRTEHSDKMCLVMAANVDSSRIFRTVQEDCNPVSTKSRRCSNEDTTFINEEVNKLLNEGIIQPSKSLWRAQVLLLRMSVINVVWLLQGHRGGGGAGGTMTPGPMSSRGGTFK